MLELKFNKRLQDSFEKNDVNQIVKNLNSPDFKSLIQVNIKLIFFYILNILIFFFFFLKIKFNFF